MNLLEKYVKDKASSLQQNPKFRAGDTLRVHVKIMDGNVERVQVFEGMCIAMHNNSLSSTFRVRRISFNEGVERIFPIYSNTIAKIEVIKYGKVRRAKLYYLRDLKGRAARVKERRFHVPSDSQNATPNASTSLEQPLEPSSE